MKDGLGDRMKENYERATKFYLPRRTPVIIRLDGRTFHRLIKHLGFPRLSKHFVFPYDKGFHSVMQRTMLALCNEVQNVVFAYHQSDEISLLLIDYKSLESQQWFNGNIQKMCSVSAGFASSYFNDVMLESPGFFSSPPHFDSRVFSIPESEVVNYFIWRQKDCIRNAILALGQKHIGKKAIHGMNLLGISESLGMKGIDISSFPQAQHYGSAAYYDSVTGWVCDKSIPLFTEDRSFVGEHFEGYLKED